MVSGLREDPPLEYLEFQNLLTSMDGPTFEHFVADLLELDGWRTEVTQSSRDGGVDIHAEAVDVDQFTDGHWLVQVKLKRGRKKVGRGVVEQLAGVERRKPFDAGIIVATNATFTEPAEDVCMDYYMQGLETKLLSGSDLYELVVENDAEELVARLKWRAALTSVENSGDTGSDTSRRS